jgi:hypothetical protein
VRRDRSTYQGIADKYDEWLQIQKSKPAPARVRSSKPYVHERHQDSDMGRTVFAAIGIGIGLVLLLLSGLAFATAARWGSYELASAQVGWNLVGFFLLVAGLGAIISTWNHNFRVLVSPPEHHH